jgi:hypothetical protein
MLTKEELAVFLALVAAFAKSTELSAARLAQVLGTNNVSILRWLAASAGVKEPGFKSVYRHTADAITRRITMLNTHDAEKKLYAGILQDSPAEKVAHLQNVLNGKAAW